LVNYLGLSEKQLVNAAHAMAADAKYELAASPLKWSIAHFGRSESLAKAERLVYQADGKVKVSEHRPIQVYPLLSKRRRKNCGDGKQMMDTTSQEE
jgi:hypothetical protein